MMSQFQFITKTLRMKLGMLTNSFRIFESKILRKSLDSNNSSFLSGMHNLRFQCKRGFSKYKIPEKKCEYYFFFWSNFYPSMYLISLLFLMASKGDFFSKNIIVRSSNFGTKPLPLMFFIQLILNFTSHLLSTYASWLVKK